ncbi:MAG: hypothetical protein C0601_01650 [Candidatus Muiribacterium halophilum]|uniref:Uncharacterized protein n=1 Tax=Muiribacterium halophilum TaxID=2053465 RepID=A0A2N5ZLR4_MUIH1|nr:MAG: hypothetical protein C0601_01650 [Candidatus Muirbacterium halophilum]
MHWHIREDHFEKIERFARSISNEEKSFDLLDKTFARLMLFNKKNVSLKEIFLIMREINNSVCR